MTAVNVFPVTTRRGITARVERRGAGRPLVWFHGAAGLAADRAVLELLAEHCCVFASEWPGFGEEATEGELDDMLDFALHGWDVIDELGLDGAPHLAGHSMGAMIAAEMACLCPRSLEKLVLIDALGLWLDDQPIPDVFAMPPHRLAETLFADPARGEALLGGGVDFSDDAAMTSFVVANARRLGAAGKILFPIPNRRLSRRLYRLRAETLLVWGEKDRLTPAPYAQELARLAPGARLEWIADAGHMAPFEQPAAVAAAIAAFLEQPSGSAPGSA